MTANSVSPAGGLAKKKLLKAPCPNCGGKVTNPHSQPKKRFCCLRCKEGSHKSTTQRDSRLRNARGRYRKLTDKELGRQMLRKRVWTGKIVRPDLCEKCGRFGAVEGHHHHGYDRAHWYDVAWLCRKCHVKEHHPSKVMEQVTSRWMALPMSEAALRAEIKEQAATIEALRTALRALGVEAVA